MTPSYNPAAGLSALLLQGKTGFNIVLRNVVGHELFPKVKFIKKEVDLIFSTESKLICWSVFKWLKLNQKLNGSKIKLGLQILIMWIYF